MNKLNLTRGQINLLKEINCTINFLKSDKNNKIECIFDKRNTIEEVITYYSMYDLKSFIIRLSWILQNLRLNFKGKNISLNEIEKEKYFNEKDNNFIYDALLEAQRI